MKKQQRKDRVCVDLPLTQRQMMTLMKGGRIRLGSKVPLSGETDDALRFNVEPVPVFMKPHKAEKIMRGGKIVQLDEEERTWEQFFTEKFLQFVRTAFNIATDAVFEGIVGKEAGPITKDVVFLLAREMYEAYDPDKEVDKLKFINDFFKLLVQKGIMRKGVKIGLKAGVPIVIGAAVSPAAGAITAGFLKVLGDELVDAVADFDGFKPDESKFRRVIEELAKILRKKGILQKGLVMTLRKGVPILVGLLLGKEAGELVPELIDIKPKPIKKKDKEEEKKKPKKKGKDVEEEFKPIDWGAELILGPNKPKPAPRRRGKGLQQTPNGRPKASRDVVLSAPAKSGKGLRMVAPLPITEDTAFRPSEEGFQPLLRVGHPALNAESIAVGGAMHTDEVGALPIGESKRMQSMMRGKGKGMYMGGKMRGGQVPKSAVNPMADKIVHEPFRPQLEGSFQPMLKASDPALK